MMKVSRLKIISLFLCVLLGVPTPTESLDFKVQFEPPVLPHADLDSGKKSDILTDQPDSKTVPVHKRKLSVTHVSPKASQKKLFMRTVQNKKLMQSLAKLPPQRLSRRLKFLGFLKESKYKKLLVGILVGTIGSLAFKMIKKRMLRNQISKVRDATSKLMTRNLNLSQEGQDIQAVRNSLRRAVSKINNYKQLLEMNLESKLNNIKI